MLVLALDTTTRAGSVAIARDGAVMRERPTDPGRSHDAQLPAALIALVDEARVPLGEIDAYAVATGPGSFTGLRVGIAAMQGLAFAARKPLIGISAFDALAQMATIGRVATWIDAWRGEVYAALYVDGQEIERPTVEPPATILARLVRQAEPHTFIGEAADIHREMILAALGSRARLAEPAAPLLAGTIARLATAAARAGHLPPPDAIRPLYVRRPDAELARGAEVKSQRSKVEGF